MVLLHTVNFTAFIALWVYLKRHCFLNLKMSARDMRSIYFICDPVHLLKTTLNNWENSFWRNKTRKLRNNGMWITWLQLLDAIENDINESKASGLCLLHK
jgi:hypothetical protein